MKFNIILSSIHQLLTLFLPLVTAPYVSRVLGAEGTGIFSYTSSIQAYFTIFAALGTGVYGVREIARNRNNKKQYSTLFWEIELLTVLTSSVAIILWLLWAVFSKEFQLIYLILTLNLFAVLFDISWFYTGLEQFVYTIGLNALFKIFGTIAIFTFIKAPSDLNAYIFIIASTSLLSSVSLWIYLPKILVKVSLDTLSLKGHLKQTLIYFVPTIATSIYTVLDKTMIGVITQNANENGYYEQATKIINILKSITFTALNSVLGARIAYLFSEKKYDEIKSRIALSLDFIFFIGMAFFFGLLSVSETFVPIFFGQGYDQVIYLLYVFSPIVVIIGVSNCLGSQYYTPAGLRSQSAKYIIIGSVLNLLLNLVFIPVFRSKGAVISSVLAELLITFLYVKNSNGYVDFKQLASYFNPRFIAGFIMYLIVLFIKQYLPNDLLGLLIQVLIGGMTYFMITYLQKDNILQILKAKLSER
ncbi:oligosaccharide flippase family protein [Streptococcus oralis]|uniref:oligosaccharide flippase family protein n=1 Tax=Streptococcus oralis TaxID=1303 RepID=UPI001E48C0DB|nr:oligosaccharide flippase family protein [Streptococcus oralis]MCY7080272.1 oligosaccharide flippase family protein [Streptococcus oralis]